MVGQGYILTNLGIYQMLYLADFFVSHLLEVREVKTETFGSYQRTLLLYMCAQHFAQSLVNQVGT